MEDDWAPVGNAPAALADDWAKVGEPQLTADPQVKGGQPNQSYYDAIVNSQTVKQFSKVLHDPLGYLKHVVEGTIGTVAAPGEAFKRGFEGQSLVPTEQLVPDAANLTMMFGMGGAGQFRVPLKAPLATVAPSPIQPIEGSPAPPMARTVAAKTGDPHVDAVLNSPTTKAVINNPVIDRTHDVPYMAGGSVPLDDPTVYIDRHVPETQTVKRISDPTQTVTFDPADAWVVHENVEQHTMELLTKNGMDAQEAYRVAHFEFAEKAEQAWYRAHDIDQEAAEAEQQKWLPQIQHENPENPPPNLYTKPYPHDSVAAARQEPVTERLVSAAVQVGDKIYTGVIHGEAAMNASKDLGLTIKQFSELPDVKTTGFVTSTGRYVSREEAGELVGIKTKKNYQDLPYLYKDVTDTPPTPDEIARARQIIEDNGDQLAPHTIDIKEATDLGVVGGEKEPVGRGAPKDDAERAIPPTGPKGELDPWQERFEHFVSKLDTGDDIKQLIRNSARENGDFLPARQGRVPLNQIEDMAAAAGVGPGEVNPRGLGRLMHNDAEMRTAMRLMMQATENVRNVGRDVLADASDQNLIKFQQSMMQRDLAVEQVMGMRAEWGRTGNVIQEFMRDVKDQAGLTNFLKDKGRSISDLKEIARGLDNLDNASAAKVLNDQRTPMNPFYYTWVQGLISGVVTHAKYFFTNLGYAGMEHGTTPILASIIGELRTRTGLGSEVDRVFLGEGMASTWGLISAVPHAFTAAGKSIYAGMRLPLKSELELRQKLVDDAAARGETAKIPRSLMRATETEQNGQRPIPGVWGRIIGVPGDLATGLHTVFRVMGERAVRNAEAYNKAASEGLTPGDGQFWDRMNYHIANPATDVLERAVDGAAKGTFMQELGPHGRTWQRLTKEIPGVKWVFPFSHIPINLMKAAYEHTPLAFADSEMRANLLGRNGQRAQDSSIARMVTGSAVMGYFFNEAMNGRATGDYPSDPKERKRWEQAGKLPNAMLINGEWVEVGKLGPAGDLARMGATLAQVVPHLTSGEDDAMFKATWELARGAGNMVADEVGFLSLRNIFDALSDPRKADRIIAGEIGTALPFSSLIGQTASYFDPNMRQTKTFLDALKYRIPDFGYGFGRQSLAPKIDWAGRPVGNPGYEHLVRRQPANTDPVDLEMASLDIHPAPPVNRVGGVQLPVETYQRYAATAGSMAHDMIEKFIRQPNWGSIPADARAQIIRDQIKHAHAAAGAMLQSVRPDIVQTGVDNKARQINGDKTVNKLKYNLPALPPVPGAHPVPDTHEPTPGPVKSNIPGGIRG